MKYKVWFQEKNIIKVKVVEENDLPKNLIKKKPLRKRKIFFSFQKGDITELFYEMKIMLEANVAFKDIVEILLLSNNTRDINKILQMIKWSIENGKPIHKSLIVYQKHLGYLPLLFLKFGEKNGDMKGAIGALYLLLKEYEIIKERLFKALKYPMVLLLSLLLSLGIIFQHVLPKFEHLFLQFDTQLPFTTRVLLGIDKFLFENSFLLGLLLGSIVLVCIYYYTKYKFVVDKLLFHNIPYFSAMYQKIVIYKVFLSLYYISSSNNRFQNALEDSLKIANNKYIEQELCIILDEINNGASISYAFERTNILDDSTIRLLNTGEKSNTLEKVLGDIKDIHKKRLEKSIVSFTSSLEPILIFILATIILFLVLAIMTPIWEMGNLMN